MEAGIRSGTHRDLQPPGSPIKCPQTEIQRHGENAVSDRDFFQQNGLTHCSASHFRIGEQEAEIIETGGWLPTDCQTALIGERGDLRPGFGNEEQASQQSEDETNDPTSRPRRCRSLSAKRCGKKAHECN